MEYLYWWNSKRAITTFEKNWDYYKFWTFVDQSIGKINNIIKTFINQLKSKPHLTLLLEGRFRGRGFETDFFPKWKCFFLIELGWYDRQKTTLEKYHFCRLPTYFNSFIFFKKKFEMICINQLRSRILTFKRVYYQE
jgi:hypothetical protein